MKKHLLVVSFLKSTHRSPEMGRRRVECPAVKQCYLLINGSLLLNEKQWCGLETLAFQSVQLDSMISKVFSNQMILWFCFLSLQEEDLFVCL